ncbi:MAG: hypothetical protein LC655_07500, partial [Bacteroidales bacterium]|nr:hypothetical protein [Bacteroidales bacterium]
MIHARIMRAIIRPGIIIPVFFLSFSHNIAGQPSFPAARSMSLGKIRSVSTSAKCNLQNPALLGFIKNNYFSAGHARPFVIQELGITSLEGVVKASPGAFHFRTDSYGLKGYRIFSSELGFGMPLSEKISAGVSFHYSNIFTSDSWNYLWSLSPGAGIHYRISSATSLALLLNNPFSPGNYTRHGPLLPSALSIGVSHEIYLHTTLLAEITHTTPGLLQVRTGLEYRLNGSVLLRTG